MPTMPTISGSYSPSVSSSTTVPEPWEEDCDIDVSFMTEYPTVCYALHPDQLWVSVLIAISTEKVSFFDTQTRFKRYTPNWGVVH